MMLFANWEKPVKLTTAAVLLFPLCAQAGILRGHRDPGSCSVALRVFDKLSPTLSVQSVSLSNTPSEALLSNATPGVQPFPPAPAGVFLSRLGISPETHRGTEQPIPFVPEHPKGPVLRGFPSTPVLEVSVGVSLPTVNQSRSGAGATSLHDEDRELCPGSLLFASKYNAVLLHSMNQPAVN